MRSKKFIVERGTQVFTMLLIYWSLAYWYAGDALVGDVLITGKDEIGYESKTANILAVTEGIFDIFLPSNIIYAQSIQFGHSMFLAFIRRLASDSFFWWLVVNNAIYVFGCYFFAKFYVKYTNIKKFNAIFIGLCCYLPLALHAYSLMRDGIIFALASFALYFYVKRWIGCLFIILLLLSVFRVHMTLAILVFVFVDLFFASGVGSSKNNRMYLVGILTASLFFLNIITGGFFVRKVIDLVSGMSIGVVLIDFSRFWISPLPWSVSEELPLVISFWFWMVFPFIILLTLYLIIELIRGRFFAVIPPPFFFMFFFYFLIYSFEGTLGFRQVAGIAPFVFVPLIIEFMKVGGGMLKKKSNHPPL